MSFGKIGTDFFSSKYIFKMRVTKIYNESVCVCVFGIEYFASSLLLIWVRVYRKYIAKEITKFYHSTWHSGLINFLFAYRSNTRFFRGFLIYTEMADVHLHFNTQLSVNVSSMNGHLL